LKISKEFSFSESSEKTFFWRNSKKPLRFSFLKRKKEKRFFFSKNERKNKKQRKFKKFD
jgi:hypothetical protein